MFNQCNTRIRMIAAFLVSLVLCMVLIPIGAYAYAETTDEGITFYLNYGNVEIGISDGSGNYEYKGYDSSGTLVSGTHSNGNKYFVTQIDAAVVVESKIILIGNSSVPEYDVTLRNIDCSGEINAESGGIYANASNPTPMKIVLRVQGDNRVGRIHYATSQATASSLKITSAAGDGYTDGSITANSNKNWSAAIGGIDDTDQEISRYITIAGGTVFASVDADAMNPAYGTAAIGGGGNGISDITITGGIVNASNSGTGATIGGGGGRGLTGGVGNVTITGGVVNATNNYFGGVAIGGGSSWDSFGNATTVNITGGTVNATGGIGGGHSISATGGNATVQISGGTVNVQGAVGICGGNSTNSTGGTVDVTISGGTVKANTISGGVGVEETATGELCVTGGSILVNELPTATSATSGTEDITMRAITVPGITKVTLVKNVFITYADGTTSYPYESAMYTDETGTLYLWIPATCIVKTVTTLENEEEKNTTITTNAPTYTITIPEAVNISVGVDSFELKGERSNFMPTDEWHIAVATESGLFELSDGELSLTYELRLPGGQNITSGMEVATFVGNGTDMTRIYYEVIDSPQYSGTYTDTLIFTVSAVNG